MTAKKVSELTALTVPASEDLILIVDDPSGEPISKKITLGNLTRTVTSNLVSSNTLFANTIQANVNFFTGSSTNNTAITSTSIRIGNSSSNSVLTQNTITVSTANLISLTTNTANVTSLFRVGSNVSVNSSHIFITNGTVNTVINAAQATFGANVQINGELIVSGAITVLDTPELWINDSNILLNADLPSDYVPTDNSGFTVNRGVANSVSLIWNEGVDKWQISNPAGTYANIAIEGSGSSEVKEWVNPETEATWSIVERSDGIRVSTLAPGTEDINTVSDTTVVDSSQVRVPRDGGAASNRLQEFWDGDVNYDYTRIVIDGTEYEGFITTYNSTQWILQIDSGPVSVNTGDPVTVRYYLDPEPVKWFDAEDYPNANNFLSAKVDYYAYVEGRGQQTGTIWFTASHDDEYDFDTSSQNETSGEDIDLEMALRPSAQSAFKSLWLVTNSGNSEPVSIIWDAKMFYGANASINPVVV